MDITPYLGTIVTVVIAFGVFYGAVSSRLTRLETMIEALTKTVDRHNHVVDRTTKLEAEVENLYHRYDEIRKED